MSGRILIVDELATNRIVLKVKLSAAYYDVIQARSGAEAIKLARASHPDLILANGQLADLDGEAFVQNLQACDDLRDIPVVLILNSASEPAKLSALRAGASEVLTKPIEEPLLLARLRSLLRQRHSDQDLQMHASTARALGFSEAQHGFQRPGRIALVSTNLPEIVQLRTTLSARTDHEFITLTPEHVSSLAGGKAAPDIFVLQIDSKLTKDGLRLMAELRAAPRTRNCPVIVICNDCTSTLPATILDMGASDVICEPVNPQELMLRISAQLRFKQSADQMRNRLQDGLQAAVIDPLTGLHNRRYALPFLNRLIGSATHDGQTFAVMVADIDHFKRVNDSFGHAAGDAVLTRVAHELRDNLREEDMIARIGGEEFLIVIPDTSRSQAAQTASRLCRIIQRTMVTLPQQPEPVHVTISIGVALGPSSGPGTTLPTAETLLDQADQALYGAKADGRNKVTLSVARPAA